MLKNFTTNEEQNQRNKDMVLSTNVKNIKIGHVTNEEVWRRRGNTAANNEKKMKIWKFNTHRAVWRHETSLTILSK